MWFSLVKVWDVKTGKEVHSLSGHTDEIEVGEFQIL